MGRSYGIIKQSTRKLRRLWWSCRNEYHGNYGAAATANIGSTTRTASNARLWRDAATAGIWSANAATTGIWYASTGTHATASIWSTSTATWTVWTTTTPAATAAAALWATTSTIA